ncbi:MAG: helix-hairpin-helix domain-containing protein [Saprospiraceae bacterium]|nr:helix-hairpin-helix domain-containing protein [Saprospiraceae bacterium]
MTNKEIARFFNKLAKIMELHKENPFKIRSYSNAYLSLRKIEKPFTETSKEEIAGIRGVGKAIADKIHELIETGNLSAYQKYEAITPPGVIEMLGIKGFGPKKIQVIWKELEIETIGELLYACNENRLIDLKGFGLKTQATLKKQLEYYIDSRGKYHYDSVAGSAAELEEKINRAFPDDKSELVGLVKRMMPEVKGIEILTTADEQEIIEAIDGLGMNEDGTLLQYNTYPVFFNKVDSTSFGTEAFKQNSSEDFIECFETIPVSTDEQSLFDALQMAYVHPEYRESSIAYEQSKSNTLPTLIETSDIKGVVHNHSTYSDGLHSVDEMAMECMRLGYEYFVISDHSKAAFYANGLSEDRVIQQMDEIDQLNAGYKDFRIFKSIECDILNDGSMDYGDDFLKEFEIVIASIHSNLKMDMQKANNRLLRAIENPRTHILGHPTSRLLLAREGYPIDHALIIDACAANNMVIELNANPARLDLDWSWIPYALEKGVKISINPDAHSKDQIRYIEAGVCAARKGGLTKEMCLNAMNRVEFGKWVDSLQD